MSVDFYFDYLLKSKNVPCNRFCFSSFEDNLCCNTLREQFSFRKFAHFFGDLSFECKKSRSCVSYPFDVTRFVIEE